MKGRGGGNMEVLKEEEEGTWQEQSRGSHHIVVVPCNLKIEVTPRR